ncbi:MAG: NYN domain-containing protein [Actinobacteria bacterium]|nr:NYN domain-containing protein [Actinomycetota bacterium]
MSTQDCGWKLDFGRFYVYLKDKYKVSKTFLFIGYVADNEALYTFLRKAGYIVVFKPTLEYRKRGKLYTKGNVDAELVLHAMIEYSNYDKAIIISGDGDFHCLVEYLEKQGKLLHIMIPNSGKYSALLRKYRRYFVYLDKLGKKLGRK